MEPSNTSVLSLSLRTLLLITSILSNSVINLPPYYPTLAGGFTFQTLANELVSSSLLLSYQSIETVITDSASSVATASRSL